MSGNHTEYTVEHQLPGLQPAEPALVKKAYAAPSFVCIDVTITDAGGAGSSDSGIFS